MMTDMDDAEAIASTPGRLLMMFLDGSELSVDRSLLIAHSRVLGDMLTVSGSGNNATERLEVPEERLVMENMITVMRGEPLPGTYSRYESKVRNVWSAYGVVLVAADKYNMPLVKERCEKYLMSRLLRVPLVEDVGNYVFVTRWLDLCRQYNLTDLGYALSSKLGEILPNSNCFDFANALLKLLGARHDPHASIAVRDLEAMLAALKSRCR